MSQKSLQEAQAVLTQLKADLNQNKLPQAAQQLTKLKILLTNLSFLAPDVGTEKQVFLLSREAVELGAYWAIKSKDVAAFQRYMAQVHTYYFDIKSDVPQSDKMYLLFALNLTLLLAQNKISEFYTQLELLPVDSLKDNVYIKFALHLATSLLEGSYNNILKAKTNIPSEEFSFFVGLLIGTSTSETATVGNALIRDEIAKSVEVAYESLNVDNAQFLFYLKDSNELIKYVKEKGWTLSAADKKIYFESVALAAKELHNGVNQDTLATQLLGYAHELEKIV